jgi:hypothetical protein
VESDKRGVEGATSRLVNSPSLYRTVRKPLPKDRGPWTPAEQGVADLVGVTANETEDVQRGHERRRSSAQGVQVNW